ncbi:MAG TPA: hypothetical protein VF292_01145 [Rhodanobacteraceae bacterium]
MTAIAANRNRHDAAKRGTTQSQQYDPELCAFFFSRWKKVARSAG